MNLLQNPNIPIMKIFTRKTISLPLFLLLFVCGNSQAQTITRGPYLQVGKQDSITIRWRTSTTTNSKVTWGPAYIASPGVYPNSLTTDVATPVTEHIVRHWVNHAGTSANEHELFSNTSTFKYNT